MTDTADGMRILIVTQYFFPETGATSNRLGAFARHLSALGHDVHVLAEKPNHPRGVVFEGYEEGVFNDRTYGDVPVTYCWVWTQPNKGFVARLLFYLSFMVSSVLGAVRLGQRYDVVLASSPPLTVGPAGWLMSRVLRARFVFDVRDLWPDVAVALGELSEGWLARLAHAVEGFVYRGADGITAVTEGFCRDIRERVGADTPVVRVSNGTEPEVFGVADSQEKLRLELDLPEKFIVTYAGNVGIAQGFSHVLDAAEILDQAGEDVLFLVVGDGPLRDDIRHDARTRGLANIEFRDRVELAEAARYMAASDALLVPLRERPIFRKFVPSKLYDSMAAGRPVLVSVDGEARDILEEAGAGRYYPAEDPEGLVASIRQLRSNPEADELGRAGRRYVTRHFTRTEQARRMASFLEFLVEPPSAEATEP